MSSVVCEILKEYPITRLFMKLTRFRDLNLSPFSFLFFSFFFGRRGGERVVSRGPLIS